MALQTLTRKIRLRFIALAACSLLPLGGAAAQDHAEHSAEQHVENLVTKFSAGPVMLGATIAEAQAAAPDWQFVRGFGDENSITVEVKDGDKTILVLGTNEMVEADEDGNPPPMDMSATIHFIEILDPRFVGIKGFRPGMLLADAEKDFGPLVEMYNYPHMGEFGKFTYQPEYLSLTFSLPAEAAGPEIYQAGIYEAVPDCADDAYPPSCRVAKKYNPGSIISGMSISEELPEASLQRTVQISGMPDNFHVTIKGPTDCGAGSEITTYEIWSSLPYALASQSIEIAGVDGCLEEPKMRQRIAYDDQTRVLLGDYNFDGLTDIALFEGNIGGYGSASYKVYSFYEPSGAYEENSALSKLTGYLGMFEVDEENEILYVFAKSGCCFHQKTGYKVNDWEPMAISEYTREVTPAGKLKITEKTLVDGKWITKERVEDMPEEDAS